WRGTSLVLRIGSGRGRRGRIPTREFRRPNARRGVPIAGVDPDLARGFGLDLANRFLEPSPLARDVVRAQRGRYATQLREQRGARAFIQRPASIAGVLLKPGDRAGD